MDIYRVATNEYIKDFSGTGAKLYGGRWNEKGTPLLYCSENRSLAILEVLVHFDGITIPNNLMIATLSIPENDITEFSTAKFNRIKKSINAEFTFKKEGEKWIKSSESLCLKVPSIITKGEFNILVNPIHKNYSKLKKKKIESLELDKRFFK